MPPSRPYHKARRAEQENATRARIVDAAESLHGTVGPARATVSAVAQRAGVTRATVYRHFPDDEALFMACSAQWLSRQRVPNPDRWIEIDDPLERLQVGLLDIYRYYRDGEAMIRQVLRDVDVVPARVKAQRLNAEERWRRTLLDPLPSRQRTTLRAAVIHATAFTTWDTLCHVAGLTERSAVRLMVGMISTAIGGRAR